MQHLNRTLGTVALSSVTLALVLGTPALAQTVKLERKFRPGTTCYIERVVETHKIAKGSMLGDTDETAIETFGVWEKTSAAKDGRNRLELVFDRVAMTIPDEEMGPTSYDTDTPNDPEAAVVYKTIFTPMLGKSMITELDQAGKVVSFTGWPEITKAIDKAAVANMAWYMLQQSGNYSEDSMRRTWAEDPMLFYTNKEHKVGDTWEVKAPFASAGLGKVNRDDELKLEKLDKVDGHTIAVLSLKRTTSTSKQEPKEKEEGRRAQPTPELTGTAVGEIIYDVDLGRIIRVTAHGETHVKITYPPRREGAKPHVMTVDVQTKINVRVMTEKERQAQRAQTKS